MPFALPALFLVLLSTTFYLCAVDPNHFGRPYGCSGAEAYGHDQFSYSAGSFMWCVVVLSAAGQTKNRGGKAMDNSLWLLCWPALWAPLYVGFALIWMRRHLVRGSIHQ